MNRFNTSGKQMPYLKRSIMELLENLGMTMTPSSNGNIGMFREFPATYNRRSFQVRIERCDEHYTLVVTDVQTCRRAEVIILHTDIVDFSPNEILEWLKHKIHSVVKSFINDISGPVRYQIRQRPVTPPPTTNLQREVHNPPWIPTGPNHGGREHRQISTVPHRNDLVQAFQNISQRPYRPQGWSVMEEVEEINSGQTWADLARRAREGTHQAAPAYHQPGTFAHFGHNQRGVETSQGRRLQESGVDHSRQAAPAYRQPGTFAHFSGEAHVHNQRGVETSQGRRLQESRVDHSRQTAPAYRQPGTFAHFSAETRGHNQRGVETSQGRRWQESGVDDSRQDRHLQQMIHSQNLHIGLPTHNQPNPSSQSDRGRGKKSGKIDKKGRGNHRGRGPY